MKDFWTFDKEKVVSVNSVLKDQADLLTKKTDGVLQGKLMNCRIKEEYIKYDLVTLFQVVVPNLDNYTCTLFQVFSMANKDYPVCISSKEADYRTPCIDDFAWLIENGAEVHNEQEFEEVLKELLSSKGINETISALYGKASV